MPNRPLDHKKNIAFFTHGDRNIGGGEQSWYFLVSRLDRERFAPVVFYSVKNRVVEQMEGEGIPVVPLRLHPKITSVYRDQVRFNPWSLAVYLCHLVLGVIRLARLLKQHRIDILHVHDNLAKIIGVPAAKLAGIKIITNCNDQLGASFIDRLLLGLQRRFMDKVFCVTRYIGHTFSRNGSMPDNVAVVYSAIEPRQWVRQARPKGDKVILGMVAVFDPVKGHRVLFEAIQRLVGAGVTGFVCRVIGDGREREGLHRFVAEAGLKTHIEFAGYVHQLKPAMEEIDILIVPSLQESFGMAAVEAMAMEIPVIASRVGGLPEVVAEGETGLLVEPADPQALADAIQYLMVRPDLRAEMGRKGRERVEQLFDIDKNLKVSEKIIWDLVSGGDGPLAQAI